MTPTTSPRCTLLVGLGARPGAKKPLGDARPVRELEARHNAHFTTVATDPVKFGRRAPIGAGMSFSLLSRVVGGRAFALLASVVAVAGCGDAIDLPLVTPPVKDAAPTGLKGPAGSAKSADLLPSPGAAFKERFFTGHGPTDILGTLLPTLDSTLQGLNSKTSTSGCLTQTPVAYTIQPFGQSVTLYAQCHDNAGGGFIQFGVQNGTTYIYQDGGIEKIAAIVTPTSATQYRVQAWLTLGAGNAASTCGAVPGYGADWDTCSYGVMELSADPTTQHIELAVAGVGFGFCGAQIVSDGANIYAIGSGDMGETCTEPSSACLAAADAETPAVCTPAEQVFGLTALGRRAATRSDAAAHGPANNGQVITTWGASQYPDVDNIDLNGTATDSVHAFGPSAPTAGVGAL
jgi:hypothetical protein